MLSDPAVHGDRRAQLAADVLSSSSLSDATKQIVEEIVRASWSKPADLVDAADELAAQALFAGAEQADALDEVEDELFRFGRILNREPALRSALTDPSLPAERKVELLDALLDDRVQDATRVLVRELALHPRGRTIDRGLEDYARMAAARRERLVARVRTVVPLTDAQLTRLASALADAARPRRTPQRRARSRPDRRADRPRRRRTLRRQRLPPTGAGATGHDRLTHRPPASRPHTRQ